VLLPWTIRLSLDAPRKRLPNAKLCDDHQPPANALRSPTVLPRNNAHQFPIQERDQFFDVRIASQARSIA
jgi:hypothetical protein